MEGQVVRFRGCTCPGTPHIAGWDPEHPEREGDDVTLRPFLAFEAGAEALRILMEASGDASFLDEKLGPVYLREGPLSWNVVDEQGPVGLDLLALPYEEASLIVDVCDDLYSERVMRPLLQRLSESSPDGPTATTSATPRSSRKARSRAERSSPVTSAAGDPTEA